MPALGRNPRIFAEFLWCTRRLSLSSQMKTLFSGGKQNKDETMLVHVLRLCFPLHHHDPLLRLEGFEGFRLPRLARCISCLALAIGRRGLPRQLAPMLALDASFLAARQRASHTTTAWRRPCGFIPRTTPFRPRLHFVRTALITTGRLLGAPLRL